MLSIAHAGPASKPLFSNWLSQKTSKVVLMGARPRGGLASSFARPLEGQRLEGDRVKGFRR